MNTVTLILLIVVVAVLFMASIWLFMPNSQESVNIHLDKDTKMNISKAADGVHIALVGAAAGGDMEADLFPQVEMEVAAPTPLTRDFWLKVARLEDLGSDERESLCGILVEHNIITAAERDYFLSSSPRTEEGPFDVMQPAAPWEEDPSSISPADDLPAVFEDEVTSLPVVDDISDDEF